MIPQLGERTPGEPLPSGGPGPPVAQDLQPPRHGSLEEEEDKEKTALPPTPIPFSSSFISLLL